MAFIGFIVSMCRRAVKGKFGLTELPGGGDLQSPEARGKATDQSHRDRLKGPEPVTAGGLLDL